MAITYTHFAVITEIFLVFVAISGYCSRYQVNNNWSTTKIKFPKVELYIVIEVENLHNTLMHTMVL